MIQYWCLLLMSRTKQKLRMTNLKPLLKKRGGSPASQQEGHGFNSKITHGAFLSLHVLSMSIQVSLYFLYPTKNMCVRFVNIGSG